ncbi:MAG: glycosyltransferase family 4 protein, partial [Phycisphaerae bacterium]
RRLYALEAKRLAIVERHGVRQHDVCLVVNERERRKLLDRTYPRQTGVLRTCVDVARYVCLNPAEARAHLPHEPIVGTVGSMFYPPNVRAVNWFGRYVWPLVVAARPDAQWLIVGSRPTRAVRSWGRLPGVTVTGYVPDVLPYFNKMRAFVNPVEGDLGVQSKVIVAMAAGKPVVITPDGAAGIDYDDRAPFLITGSPRGFADAVLRLLKDDALALDLVERGRRVIDANYRVETQLPQLEHWLQPKPAGLDRHDAPTRASARKRLTRTASSRVRPSHEVAG